jgi:predicted RND superfamily exporter protein
MGPIKVDVEKAITDGKISLKDSMLISYLLMGGVEYSFYYNERYQENTDDLVIKAWDILFKGIASSPR